MKVEKFKIKDWKDSESGLIVDENEEWILIKHIPVDYVIDGYKIIKKKFIESRIQSKKEKDIEKVLKLKKIEINKPDNFKFNNTIGLLEWVEKYYDIFEFQDDDESQLFYGKINFFDGQNLTIDIIYSDGSIEYNYEYEFNINDIRVITFESDYHISMRLLWKDKLNI